MRTQSDQDRSRNSKDDTRLADRADQGGDRQAALDIALIQFLSGTHGGILLETEVQLSQVAASSRVESDTGERLNPCQFAWYFLV